MTTARNDLIMGWGNGVVWLDQDMFLTGVNSSGVDEKLRPLSN